MKRIPVGHGRYALVDDRDYEVLVRRAWHCRKKTHRNGSCSYYAVSNERRKDGTYRQFVMHKMVAVRARLDGGLIDHRDRNTLNNCRANLRSATAVESNANRRSWAVSGLKGVTQLPSGRWRARIKVAGRDKSLGAFDTKEQAHAAYKKAAKHYFKEFANP